MESEHESNLMMAIVQAQDADIAEHALKAINIDSYQMPSVGGFLGRKNVTLIIDAPAKRNDEIIEMAKKKGQLQYLLEHEDVLINVMENNDMEDE